VVAARGETGGRKNYSADSGGGADERRGSRERRGGGSGGGGGGGSGNMRKGREVKKSRDLPSQVEQ